jgi:hypothetical protein
MLENYSIPATVATPRTNQTYQEILFTTHFYKAANEVRNKRKQETPSEIQGLVLLM